MSEDNPIPKNNRLDHALEILGVSDNSPKHHRYNLVSSIALYAGRNGDEDLENQCQVLMSKIKLEDSTQP